MAELDERYAHLDARKGLTPASILSIAAARDAIRSTVPTRWHAMRLGEALLGELGPRGFRDPASPDDELAVYLRCADDSRLLVAKPLLTLTKGPGSTRVVMTFEMKGGVLPEDAPDGWKPGDPPYLPAAPAMQLRPRGPEMCGGKLTLSEGRSEIAIEYDELGIKASGFETGGDGFTWARRPTTSPYMIDTLARPPRAGPISVALSPDLAEGGIPTDALAVLLARGAAAERCAARVLLPVPTPDGAAGAMAIGLTALRPVLFGAGIPLDARWVVADGLEGKAIAWAATKDEALARFQDELFRKKPRSGGSAAADEPRADQRRAEAPPPAPPAPTAPSQEKRDDGSVVFSTGLMHFSFPGRAPRFPWPRAVPANCPAVLVPLPVPPDPPAALAAAGFVRVARTLDDAGVVGHVFVREDRAGFTGIGEHVVDVVDVTTLDAELTLAFASHDADLALVRRPGDDFSDQHLVLSVFDDERRVRTAPKVCGAGMAAHLGPPAPPGDVAPWRVLVARRLA